MADLPGAAKYFRKNPVSRQQQVSSKISQSANQSKIQNRLMERVIKTGVGWRLGWSPEAREFQGLVAGDGWAIELTEAELNDFCRLLGQLAATISQMASELMDEEKIAIEAETEWLWVQVEGYPEAYSVQLILNAGRRGEGFWPAAAASGLVQAAKVLKVF